MKLTQRASPNCGPRRGGALPDLVVLHYTAMTDTAAALDRLCDPAAEVSAHYLIARGGEVFQMVDEKLRAWHAGAGDWGAVDDINSRSIGIELDNSGAQPFPEPQMAALEALLPQILSRWNIPPERVIAHSDMAPARKSDPGARFDWRRLALGGLSVWPDGGTAVAGDPARFRKFAEAFGYNAGHSDETLLRAFRLRFRPGGAGALDALDLRIIGDLARRFPVDAPRPSP